MKDRTMLSKENFKKMLDEDKKKYEIEEDKIINMANIVIFTNQDMQELFVYFTETIKKYISYQRLLCKFILQEIERIEHNEEKRSIKNKI